MKPLAAIMMAAMLAGCASNGPPLAAAPLINTYWKLLRLGDTDVPVVDNQRESHFVLMPGDEHRLQGQAICNRLMGSYQHDGDRLKIGPVATTRMACPPGPVSEAQIIGALNATVSYRIDDQRLELIDAQGKVLATFESRLMR